MREEFSIVLVGDGPDGAEMQSLARVWAAHGLLTESAWCSPSSVLRGGGVPRVRCHLVGPQAVRDEDLLVALAARPLARVRLVVAQPLRHGAEPDTRLHETAAELADLVRTALPRDVTGPDGENGCELVRVNLLVPETGATGLRWQALQPGWEVNAVASPEDRPGLDRADVFVRGDANLVPHALTTTATVAGLWPGVPQGAFDDHQVDSTTGSDEVIVIRASVRLRPDDDLVPRLAEAAMTASTSDGRGPALLLDWAVPASEPGGVVDAVLDALRATGEWADGPRIEESVGTSPAEMSPAAAFADVARFHRRMLTSLGGWLLDRGGRGTERLLTALTVGSDGDYQVRLAPRGPGELAAAAAALVAAQQQRLTQEGLRAEAARVPAVSPDTWVELRRVCCALVDGDALPKGYPNPDSGGVRELLSPGDVVPHPGDAFSSRPGIGPVRAVDVRAARLLREQLESGAQRSPEDTPQSPPAEAGTDTGAGTGTPAGTDGDEPRRDVEALDAWTTRRSGVLLWRLAADLDERWLTFAARAEAGRRQALAELDPSVEPLERARRTLGRWWSGASALTALAVVWQLVLGWTGGLSWTETSAAASSTAVAGLSALVLANHSYYRASRAFERRVEAQLAERQRAAAAWLGAAREERRLGALYRHLLDWSEVLGWLLHEPWHPAAPRERELPDLDGNGLPAALAVARASATVADLPDELVRDAVAMLCSPGWLGRLFTDLVDALDPPGPGGRRGHLLVDTDLAGDPGGPRGRLLRALRDRHLPAVVSDQAAHRLDDHAAAGQLELPRTPVRRIGEYGARSVADAAFFADCLRTGVPFTDTCWSDTGRHGLCHVVARSVAWLPLGRLRWPEGQLEGLEVRTAHGACAVRVDYSTASRPDDLALFDAGHAVADVPAPRTALQAEAWY